MRINLLYFDDAAYVIGSCQQFKIAITNRFAANSILDLPATYSNLDLAP